MLDERKLQKRGSVLEIGLKRGPGGSVDDSGGSGDGSSKSGSRNASRGNSQGGAGRKRSAVTSGKPKGKAKFGLQRQASAKSENIDIMAAIGKLESIAR